MSTHRLEVYMDSYNSTLIINQTSQPFCIHIGDEISKEDWLDLLSGDEPQIELKVKVEDVHHLFWDADDIVHSVSIKVVPIDGD
ncbi:MAG TPA: hypothetical protein DCM54_12500 [Gammaproteobacteria bacterium]|nr:hypothetical protein [Gammaproteobacteria bacterium]|tara:strand:+ start:235 stop:486 length:252 start_codon:yes stop_codon:yes gene_type:complete